MNPTHGSRHGFEKLQKYISAVNSILLPNSSLPLPAETKNSIFFAATTPVRSPLDALTTPKKTITSCYWRNSTHDTDI